MTVALARWLAAQQGGARPRALRSAHRVRLWLLGVPFLSAIFHLVRCYLLPAPLGIPPRRICKTRDQIDDSEKSAKVFRSNASKSARLPAMSNVHPACDPSGLREVDETLRSPAAASARLDRGHPAFRQNPLEV